jgi:hypothetical protein
MNHLLWIAAIVVLVYAISLLYYWILNLCDTSNSLSLDTGCKRPVEYLIINICAGIMGLLIIFSVMAFEDNQRLKTYSAYALPPVCLCINIAVLAIYYYSAAEKTCSSFFNAYRVTILVSLAYAVLLPMARYIISKTPQHNTRRVITKTT